MLLSRRMLVVAILLAGVTFQPARGQESAPAPAPRPPESAPAPAPRAPADLEHRVLELEETVRQLQAEKAGKVIPAAAVSAPARRKVIPASAVSAPAAVKPVLPGQLPPPVAAPVMDPGLELDSNPARGGDTRGINLERPRVGEGPGYSPSIGLPPGEVAGWSNGFYLQSPDQRFVFRITGQIQADYRSYLNDNDTTDIDTFLVRRARFGLEATLFDYYEFRFMPDFGQGKAVVQDAFMNIHYWDAFQFEAGKFKQPFSYEQLIQDRYVPTMERSLIDQLTPARDVGAMFHGQKLFGNRLDYGFAISNGEINGGSTDSDLNNNKDFNGRIAVHPFGGSDCEFFLHYLEVGMSGGFGDQNQPVQPSTLQTPLGVKWFTFNPTVQAYGARSRLSPELSYFYGPFGFATQFFHMDQEMLANTTNLISRSHQIDVIANGYYIMTTLLVTGERRTGYSQAIEPLANFDPRYPFSHPGAWELVGRVSRLHLSNVFLPSSSFQLANPLTNSDGATEMTLGFNWYLNRFVRMQFNWEHSWFDTPVLLGQPLVGRLTHQDTLGMRMQVIF
jgi:phosphate-selective porin OprO/OprP